MISKNNSHSVTSNAQVGNLVTYRLKSNHIHPPYQDLSTKLQGLSLHDQASARSLSSIPHILSTGKLPGIRPMYQETVIRSAVRIQTTFVKLSMSSLCWISELIGHVSLLNPQTLRWALDPAP